MLLQEIPAWSSSPDHAGGRQGIGLPAILAKDGGTEKVMLYWPSSLRINRMRIALAAGLEILAVIARCDKGVVGQGKLLQDALLRQGVRSRPFDAHDPRRTVRLDTTGANLAAYIHQIGGNPLAFKIFRNHVAAIALGNRIEIQAKQRMVFNQAGILDTDFLPAHILQNLYQFLVSRQTARPAARRKAVSLHQRPYRDIEHAAGKLGNLLGLDQHIAESLAQSYVLVAVHPAYLGAVVPQGSAKVEGRQKGINLRLQSIGIQTLLPGIGIIADSVIRALGKAHHFLELRPGLGRAGHLQKQERNGQQNRRQNRGQSQS